MKEDHLYDCISPVPQQSSLTAASSTQRSVLMLHLKFDGVGIQAETTLCFNYQPVWEPLRSLCVTTSSLFIAHEMGVSEADISSDEPYLIKDVFLNNTEVNAYKMTRFKNGVLVSDIMNRRIWIYSADEGLHLFAGTSESTH